MYFIRISPRILFPSNKTPKIVYASRRSSKIQTRSIIPLVRPQATPRQKMSSSASTTATSTEPTANQSHYILSFYVPTTSTAEVCKKVCEESGAGTYPGGLYTEAYWTTRGTGQFKAMQGSNPTIGSAGKLAAEKVEEDKVEILCLGVECAKRAVGVLKRVHPYEEVPYYVVKSEEL